MSAALAGLYALFEVQPVAPRQLHDGRSPIAAAAGSWQPQHDELWGRLVPAAGPAATVQGEVIRISAALSGRSRGTAV